MLVGLILKQFSRFCFYIFSLGLLSTLLSITFTFLAGRNEIPPLPKEIGENAFLRVLFYRPTFLDKGPKNGSF